MSNQISWLTAEYIQKFLLDPLNDKDLKVKNFEVTPGSSVGDGYLSQIFRIKINTTKKPISIICKVLLTNSAVDVIQGSIDVYNKEKIMLESFLPKSLSKLPNPDRFFPKFYHADDIKQTLFIEDLCDDGYQLGIHESNGLDLQHSLLVMEVLAKLHATSYLVFKDDPSLIKNFEKYFNCEENRPFFDNMIKTTTASLDKVLKEWKLPEEYKKILKNTSEWATKSIKIWERKDDQLNVMIQTDCWLNNLMFKYNKNNVESVKLIDFQLGTYHSFAFDLICFIFSSTNTDVKLNHLNTLIDRYYEVFTGITGNIPDITKERIWKEFNERLFAGYLTLITFAPVILAPPKTQKPTDLETIMKGEDNSSSIEILRNPKFQDCVEKLMPYFVRNNAI